MRSALRVFSGRKRLKRQPFVVVTGEVCTRSGGGLQSWSQKRRRIAKIAEGFSHSTIIIIILRHTVM
jgi:hypothetical protein